MALGATDRDESPPRVALNPGIHGLTFDGVPEGICWFAGVFFTVPQERST
jgi:hypothetical protein